MSAKHRIALLVVVSGVGVAALVGAGEALPFAASSFHIVTCWDVLEHVQQPENLLGEIARVLDDDGVAFMTVRAWHNSARGGNRAP